MTAPKTDTTNTTTSSSSAQSSTQPKPRTDGAGAGNDLATSQGKTTIASSVVQKLAGLAARDVSGVYKLGGGAARAFGAITERIPGSGGPSASQGVSVEVGESQAAVDLDVVVEYGVAILDVASAIRRNVIQSIERMTGLEVVEVNVSVDDVHLSSDDSTEEPEESRVQ